jgi:hypothetical protein
MRIAFLRQNQTSYVVVVSLTRAIRLFVWHYNRRQYAITRNTRLKGNLSLYS